MPPVAGDFLAPKGEIEVDLFPQESASTLTARITTYIEQAIATIDTLELNPAEIDIEAAIARLVYVRLYDAILIRLGNTPDTSIADEGGIRFSAAQIAIFEAKRAEHAGAYDAIIADAVVPPSEAPVAPTTRSRVIFNF